MPFTPFHFGPGAAIHSAAPKRISFISFCVSNVLIDIEPLYYMVNDDPPLHRFFHTGLGATLVAVATIAVFLAAKSFARRFRLPNFLDWQKLSLYPVAVGAFIGTYSHIGLDSLMHADIRPFAPFSESNPLLGVISIPALEAACVVAGLIGGVVLLLRYVHARRLLHGRQNQGGIR